MGGRVSKTKNAKYQVLAQGMPLLKASSHALNSPEKSQELKAPDVGHVGVESIGRKSEKCLESQYKEHLGPQILSSIPPIQATVPPSFCQDDRGFLFHGKFEWLHTQDARPRGSRGEMHGNKCLSTNLYIGTMISTPPRLLSL